MKASIDRCANAAALFFVALTSSCGEKDPVAPAPAGRGTESPADVELVVGAFSQATEAYQKKIIPSFQEAWGRARGQKVVFRETFQPSHSLALAVINGFETDVVALSIAEDLDNLVEAGLVRGDWKTRPHHGILTRSAVVLAVRKGNPRGIHEWSDLVQAGLGIVLPEPTTSGTGRSGILAIHGAAMRGHAGVGASDPDAAERFLASVLRNVVALEADTRESIEAFERGLGDVAITLEDDVIRGRMFGHDYERVIPNSTLLTESSAVVIGTYADRHGVREVAEAFLAYLDSAEAQQSFAFYGMRPVDEELAAELSDQYPSPEDLWTIEDLGGWKKVSAEYFGDGGILDRAMKTARAK